MKKGYTEKMKQTLIYNILLLFLSPIGWFISIAVASYYVKLISTIIIFYILFGYFTYHFILKIIKYRSPNANVSLSLTEILSCVLILGLLLNIIYGVIFIPLSLYPIRELYFIFFEVLAIIMVLISEIKLSKNHFSIKAPIKKSDFGIVILLLLPIFFQLLITYYYTPFPFLVGWDIFRYQGITNEYLHGVRTYIFIWDLKKSAFFHIIQGNFVIGANIPLYFLNELYKIGIIFTNGLSTLIIYNISRIIVPSRLFCLIPAFWLASLDGRMGLGPYYFLPSSFSWVLGLFMIYFIERFLLQKNSDKSSEIQNFRDNRTLFILIFIMIFLSCFLFHYFTSLIILGLLLIILFFNRFNSKKIIILAISILFFELIILIFLRFSNLFDSEVITNFLNTHFFKDSDLFVGDVDYLYNYFFADRGLINSVFLGLASVIVIMISLKADIFAYIFSFLFFLILLFFPFPAIYRIVYIIFALNAILTSIASYKVYIYIRGLLSKIKRLRNFPLKNWLDKSLKINFFSKGENLGISLILLVFLSFSIMPEFYIFNQNYPNYDVSKVINYKDNRVYYSKYTYEEYLGGEWLYNQSFDILNTNLVSDPGLQWILYGISGIHYIQYNESQIQMFYSFLQSLQNHSINCSFFEKYSKEKGKDLILALSPRTFKWFESNSSIERYPADHSYYRSDLIEIIENSPHFDMLYHNYNMAIFRYIP